jgi:hypothetical protein
VADQVSEFEGDITSRTGSILASWFLFNPNGPTAYAFGYMEEEDMIRFFCRWVHFTGSATCVLNDFSARHGLSANFAEWSLDALIKLYNHLVTAGSEHQSAPQAEPLPSFVKCNGNPAIDRCLRLVLAHSPAAQARDWGRELYYIKKYGSDLFGRAGEETRESYEELAREAQTDPRIEKDFLEFTWHRHAHIDSFRNWSPGSYRSLPFSDAAFHTWWSTISGADFVRKAQAQFAEAWVGSMQFIQGDEFFKSLEEDGSLTDFYDLAQFFDRFHLPIYPPN